MMSDIDDVCNQIILVLAKNSSSSVDYAQLQRNVGAGSVQTVKKHVKHLLEAGLVKVETENRGMRIYYKISLSKKGIKMSRNLHRKDN